MNKYELTDETKGILHRIRALKTFGQVSKGDLDGWVRFTKTLSQWVSGDVRVADNFLVSGDARVCDIADIIWISHLGSRLGTITIFKNKDGGLSVSCGCFFGTLADFEAKVKETHSDNKYAQEYLKLVELAKIHFEQKNTL